jgi:hypothetical protein
MPTKRETLVCEWDGVEFTRLVQRGRKPSFCSDKHRQAAMAQRSTLNEEEVIRELKRRLRLANKIISNSNIRPRKGQETKVNGALQRWFAA